MDRYISPEPGTFWLMDTDDEDLIDLNGKICVVVSSDTRSECNGDGDVFAVYADGCHFPQKERRFVGRHIYIGTSDDVAEYVDKLTKLLEAKDGKG